MEENSSNILSKVDWEWTATAASVWLVTIVGKGPFKHCNHEILAPEAPVWHLWTLQNFQSVCR